MLRNQWKTLVDLTRSRNKRNLTRSCVMSQNCQPHHNNLKAFPSRFFNQFNPKKTGLSKGIFSGERNLTFLHISKKLISLISIQICTIVTQPI